MNLNNLKYFFSIEGRTRYFIHVLIYFLVASVTLFSLLIIGDKALTQKKESATKTILNPFAQIQLEAKSVVVWDVINQRELFAKNPDLPLPLASLTKVMTAVTVNKLLPETRQIVITKEDLEPEGDSQLVVGDTWSARDLRDFTLLTSSNDGALALAAVAESSGDMVSEKKAKFIEEMNDVATKIGLLNSKFFNEHGLDREADRGGAYGSARDMVTLFEYTIKNQPEILEATRYKNLVFESAEKKYAAENTNEIINDIPNVIASKTGFTDLAGGNLVIAFDVGLNQPIIISVLGSSEEGRFTDVQKLVKASLVYIHDN